MAEQDSPVPSSSKDLDFLDDLFANLFDNDDISSESDRIPDLSLTRTARISD